MFRNHFISFKGVNREIAIKRAVEWTESRDIYVQDFQVHDGDGYFTALVKYIDLDELRESDQNFNAIELELNPSLPNFFPSEEA